MGYFHSNFAKRQKNNGNTNQQYIGIIAQSVVMDFFGLGYIDGGKKKRKTRKRKQKKRKTRRGRK